MAAIGNGAMVTSLLSWYFSQVLLLGPLGCLLLYLTWIVIPATRAWVEEVLPYTLTIAIVALMALFILLAVLFMVGIGNTFVAQKNRLRDHLAALWQSRTAKRAAVSGALTVALCAVTSTPLGDFRLPALSVLTLSLVLVNGCISRGLSRINRTNRVAPYFDGLSSDERRLADQPWPELPKPSFALPSTLADSTDAMRYARRARSIAEIHTWSGAGLIVIFSAFVGTSISAMWENPKSSPVPAIIVLAAVALGFGLQRRARSYRRLADEYENRSRELERDTESKSIFRRLFKRAQTGTAQASTKTAD